MARLQFVMDGGFEDWNRVVFSDEMRLQTVANSKKVYIWRYPDEEYLEDCCGATVIPRFEKIKVWSAMRHGKCDVRANTHYTVFS